jgi:hypothetical protein
MKTNPKRCFEVLDSALLLAPAVPKTNALRNSRRVEAGGRGSFSAPGSDWMAVLRMVKRGGQRTH